MASQHPDHAGKPYWYTKEFISTRQEVKECFLTYSELGIDEYKWDWEGKYVDESVVEKLFSEHIEYFKQHELGQDKFLTFRLPNPKVETEFRLGRAFMGILGASGLAKHLGLYDRPLFEVILPMTQTAQEMIDIQEAYIELSGLKHNLFNKTPDSLKHIELIPLFEDIGTIMNSDSILAEYISLHKKSFGFSPLYMRPYIARSDPALNSGLVPTVLAVKIALSRYKKFETESGIALYPIIGSASLPFRGGLTPKTAHEFAEEYRGVRTALIQSAFRYDYPVRDVIDGIETLEAKLPKGMAADVSSGDQKEMKQVMKYFETSYRTTIEHIAPVINTIASHLPRRRERVQHTGLFGYSRGVGTVHLPRAITFTGSLYSLGVPPEVIGTGRGLARAEKEGKLGIVEKYFVHLKESLKKAMAYVNKDALSLLSDRSPYWSDIREDIRQIESYVGVQAGPISDEEKEHAALAWYIVSNLDNIESSAEQLDAAAKLRKSLG